MKTPDRTGTRNRQPSHRVHRCAALALAAMLLVNGGCTAALWDRYDPSARVWVPASQITEEQLRQEGRSYSKIRMTKQGLREMGIQCEEDVVEGYMAEKTRQQKFNDSVVLAVGTPITVVIDGVLVCCVVVGYVGLLVGISTLQNWPQWPCVTR